MRRIRPARLCRAWLFVEGANESLLANAAASGADVLIHELEDFTPPALRPKARALAPELYSAWREAGVVVAVRVNPLDGDGMDDLAAVMRGRPDIVALPKVAEPAHVVRLAEVVSRFEREYGIEEGTTALLPNIEFARGLVQTGAIATASPRVTACDEGTRQRLTFEIFLHPPDDIGQRHAMRLPPRAPDAVGDVIEEFRTIRQVRDGDRFGHWFRNTATAGHRSISL